MSAAKVEPVDNVQETAALAAAAATPALEGICSSDAVGGLDTDLGGLDLGQNGTEAEDAVSLALGNPLDDVDIGDDGYNGVIAGSTVVPSNTPVTGDSGQGSPTMQSSSESLSDDNGQARESTPGVTAKEASPASKVEVTPAGPAEDESMVQYIPVTVEGKGKPIKEVKKEEKKEEKKKSKKKEDKSIEYILRALNSLQSPEEKLAALCKKYADLHEEHRVLQASFKTQQRTMAVVMREKDQLQSEHTKAVMAKSKLESLCRELQKHNKIIKEESIKRAKEEDERRKEISAQFNTTIGEIQTQMSDNSEKNSKLRQENENLAAQLKAFIKQCEVRDVQVEKLQKTQELEKQIAEAKLARSEALMREMEEKNNKERELMLLKLAESGKKSQLLEAQVQMFKERYDEFESLHTRSSETFQKYKTEMDKMTKRIKKLEKDGLQWKTKWEQSNKSLIEQIELRSKAEKESLTYIQKTKKLESLCRALQAELHGNKGGAGDNTGGGQTETSDTTTATTTTTVPPNSPEGSSSSTPDSAERCQPSSSSASENAGSTCTTSTAPDGEGLLAAASSSFPVAATTTSQGLEGSQESSVLTADPGCKQVGDPSASMSSSSPSTSMQADGEEIPEAALSTQTAALTVS